jgi:hypothetical protein
MPNVVQPIFLKEPILIPCTISENGWCAYVWNRTR